MKPVLIFLLALMLACATACDAPALLPVEPTPTVAPPTDTPEPTVTPTATATSEPTPTQTPVVVPSPIPSSTPYVPPSADVVKLADAASMTDRARELFFATKPVIDPDRTTLDKHCRRPTSTTSVELGCFTPEGRIYILRIADPDLKSEMTVIAAHEMLHAAYAAISASEAATLTLQLDDSAKKISDEQLKLALQDYVRFEPGQRSNELHSILGTEYGTLTPELERYYQQYFKKRDLVVAAALQFRKTFTDAPARINDLKQQLADLRNTMNDEKKKGKIDAYNKDVDRYNVLVQDYNNAIVNYNRYRKVIIGS